MEVLGIEIGSSKIKGAIVDTSNGELLTPIIEVDPVKAMEPRKLVSRVHKISKKMEWKGPIGCTFPAPIRRGVVLSTDNVHESWKDVDAEHLFTEITDNPTSVVSYTDGFGIAEMRFGTGKNRDGTVLVLTIETSIGSALFTNRILVPNMELSQIEFKGISVEERASSRVRKEEGISHKAWGNRIQYILENYERIFHPELIILGGQATKKADKLFPYIKIATKCKPATFKKEAGIVGAALYSANKMAQEELTTNG